MTPLAPDDDDLELCAQVRDLIVFGGVEGVSSVLIALGCVRMVRTEIELLLRQATLLYRPPEGSA